MHAAINWPGARAHVVGAAAACAFLCEAACSKGLAAAVDVKVSCGASAGVNRQMVLFTV